MKRRFEFLCSFRLWWLCLISSLGFTTLASAMVLPLRTEGRYIVDQQGERVKLKSVNWYGPHVERQVVAGLDKQPMQHIVGLIQEWGFNSVRLPFSNQMLYDTRPVAPELISANPGLMGLTALEIFDRTVDALTQAGLLVILNNHTTSSEWCCGFDTNGLWYSSSKDRYAQSLEMWQSDWLMLVDRYRSNPLVVGADLRNEVRTSKLGDTILPVSPNWGKRDQNDWHLAAQDLGRKILDRNPDLLIIVEGINWAGTIPLLGSGERPVLKPVRDLPIRLQRPDKLVYAAHNYAFTGPQHNGDDRYSKGNPRYADMDAATLRRTLDEEWGYVLEAERYYTAPVWLSEFGTSIGLPSESDQQWFRLVVDYLLEKDVDFAYWPLNHEGYGLVSEDWSRILTDDWRYPELKRLLAAEGKPVGVCSRFSQLQLVAADDLQSSVQTDWLAGARKGSCPDGWRLLGLSQDQRALCGDVQATDLWAADRGLHVEAVNETPTRYRGTGDWAGGMTKYECPLQHYVAGFSKHWWGTSGILCARSTKPLGQSCETIWFDRGDRRLSEAGGDWAAGSYKGQCRDDQYVAGLAHKDGTARALLCCSLR